MTGGRAIRPLPPVTPSEVRLELIARLANLNSERERVIVQLAEVTTRIVATGVVV